MEEHLGIIQVAWGEALLLLGSGPHHAHREGGSSPCGAGGRGAGERTRSTRSSGSGGGATLKPRQNLHYREAAGDSPARKPDQEIPADLPPRKRANIFPNSTEPVSPLQLCLLYQQWICQQLGLQPQVLVMCLAYCFISTSRWRAGSLNNH